MLALTGCGGGSEPDTATPAEEVEEVQATEGVATEEVTEDVTEETPAEEVDFDGTGLEEVGDFEFYIASAGGTSEDGNIPTIVTNPEIYGDIFSVNVFGGDGTVCVVYIDGHERGKVNAGDTSTSITGQPEDRTEGVHLVELVSYGDNGATVYRKAQYEVVN